MTNQSSDDVYGQQMFCPRSFVLEKCGCAWKKRGVLLALKKTLKKLKKGLIFVCVLDTIPRLCLFEAIRKAYRGVAQLVEHRSPKPRATGSIPVAPATSGKGKYKGKKGIL